MEARRTACACALGLMGAGAWAAWQANGARAAANPQVSSGPVGIVRGQTTRFSLTNVGDERGLAVDGARFYDAAGTVVAECEGARLQMGQMFSCDFDGGRLDVAGRIEVTAVIAFHGHEPDVAASVQVFDNDDAATRAGWGPNHDEILVRDSAEEEAR